MLAETLVLVCSAHGCCTQPARAPHHLALPSPNAAQVRQLPRRAQVKNNNAPRNTPRSAPFPTIGNRKHGFFQALEELARRGSKGWKRRTAINALHRQTGVRTCAFQPERRATVPCSYLVFDLGLL